ncbi:MAG: peptide ABC transporter substrate-binding protein [Chlamydiia bacterium]|nr:peptide ABC transporter substrate-binding protein [Chlamydiia bacterium]
MKKVLLFFLLSIFVCACGKKEESKDERKVLKLAFRDKVRTLDPRYGGETPASHMIRMLYDGLCRRGVDGNIYPALAKRYDISEDQLTYTFHLRESEWSDGTPLTAYDFEHSWKTSLDPNTLGHGAQNFYVIKNAKKVVKGQLPVDAAGIRAIDDLTLVVTLEYPTPYLMEIISCTLFYPVPKHLDKANSHWATNPEASFVSNGPFRVKSWQKGNRIVVEKNPNYWDVDNVKLDEIEVAIVEDPMTHLYLFEKGEIDWLGAPLNETPPDAITTLRKEYSVQSFESPFVYWFFVNTEKFPFTNQKLRQALAYAIHRQELVEGIFDHNASPAMGILSPCFKMGNPPFFLDGNQEKARELFNEALEEIHLNLETFPEIVVNYPANSDTTHRLVQAIQQQWKKALGLEVKLQQLDWPVHFTKIQNGDYQLGFMGWTSYIGDPIYMLKTFMFRDDTVNMSNWESESFQARIDASNLELDPEKRMVYLREAEAILMDEMPILPLFFKKLEFSKKPGVSGVACPATGEIDFKFAQVDTNVQAFPMEEIASSVSITSER